MRQIALDIGLAPEPSLDNFVAVGNEAALNHLRLWTQDGARAPVPTYLWGGEGCGKTHLLRAVYLALRDHGVPVGWMDAHMRHPSEFDEDWRVVILDDVHLYDAEQQHMAFKWFVNALTPQTGDARWLLASGNAAPMQLQLRDDLRSRLGWGHVYSLHVPDDEARRAVLRQAADARGLFLSDEVMSYMLNRFSRDLSSLMQLLDNLDQYALQTRRAITIPLLKSMLENE